MVNLKKNIGNLKLKTCQELPIQMLSKMKVYLEVKFRNEQKRQRKINRLAYSHIFYKVLEKSLKPSKFN